MDDMMWDLRVKLEIFWSIFSVVNKFYLIFFNAKSFFYHFKSLLVVHFWFNFFRNGLTISCSEINFWHHYFFCKINFINQIWNLALKLSILQIFNFFIRLYVNGVIMISQLRSSNSFSSKSSVKNDWLIENLIEDRLKNLLF